MLGHGVALLNAAGALAEVEKESADEETCVSVVRWALERPMRGIVQNAGLHGPDVAQEVLRRQEPEDN